jgi:hypothetical protein
MIRLSILLALVILCLGILLALAEGQNIPAYKRSEWRHWVDADNDCQNTRAEVLIAKSRVAVSFEGKKTCRVIAGEWLDTYTGVIIRNAGLVDIDHTVSLKEAHDAGGWRWSAAQKQAYANDLKTPGLLVVTQGWVNASKSSRTPEDWLPPVNRLAYVAARLQVKLRYDLEFSAAELAAMAAVLDQAAQEVLSQIGQ